MGSWSGQFKPLLIRHTWSKEGKCLMFCSMRCALQTVGRREKVKMLPSHQRLMSVRLQVLTLTPLEGSALCRGILPEVRTQQDDPRLIFCRIRPSGITKLLRRGSWGFLTAGRQQVLYKQLKHPHFPSKPHQGFSPFSWPSPRCSTVVLAPPCAATFPLNPQQHGFIPTSPSTPGCKQHLARLAGAQTLEFCVPSRPFFSTLAVPGYF